MAFDNSSTAVEVKADIPPPRGLRPTPAAFAVVALACIMAFWVNLGAMGIVDLDEGLYVEAAREMLVRGDYVAPRVGGELFYEKPPLTYWVCAVSMQVFGRNELAARLPSALAATLICFTLLWVGTSRFGRTAGLTAALAYPLSPIPLGIARQMTTDSLLTLWILLAVLCGHKCLERRAGEKGPWTLFWVFCALGLLTKGVVGTLLPVAILVVYATHGPKDILRALHHTAVCLKVLPGIVLLALIAAPWHIAAWQASGSVFFDEYIVRQHIGRFRGGDTAHKAPFWFFVPAFLVGFFPWSVFTASSLARRRADLPADGFIRLLKCWFWVVFVFFSISGSKLVSYILPLYPAAALLTGAYLSEAIEAVKSSTAVRRCAAIAAGMSGGMGLALLFHRQILSAAERLSNRPIKLDAIPPELLLAAQHLFGAMAIGCLATWALVLANRARPAVVSLLCGSAAFALVAAVELVPVVQREFIADLHAAVQSASRSATNTGADLVIAVGPPRRPSCLFYASDQYLSIKSHHPEVSEIGHDDLESVEGDARIVTRSPDIGIENKLIQTGRMSVVSRHGKWIVLSHTERMKVTP